MASNLAARLRDVRRAIIAVLVLSAFTIPLRAQRVPGSEITVSLITVAPGARPWEMFGHNAIRIRDGIAGTDLSYNYGLFSFEQESFILRFIRGRMLYWMAGLDTERMLQSYVGADRSVWEQELDISPAQRLELRDALEENARPENAYYRYDYYYDNCSTRVRDAIDRAIGGRLRDTTFARETGTTFRSHTQRLTTGSPLLYTGLLLGLGNPVDRPISAWEEMFLPLKVMEYVRDVRLPAEDGGMVPLVGAERLLFQSTGAAERATPPAWLAGYLLLGMALGAVILWLSRRQSRGRVPRIAFAVVAGGWTLLIGMAGLVLLGLWTLTDHAAAYWNENLLCFSPIAFPLAAFLFVGVQRLGGSRRAALWLGVALAASSALGLMLQILPGLDQVNGQLVALALPVNLAVACSVYQLVESREQ